MRAYYLLCSCAELKRSSRTPCRLLLSACWSANHEPTRKLQLVSITSTYYLYYITSKYYLYHITFITLPAYPNIVFRVSNAHECILQQVTEGSTATPSLQWPPAAGLLRWCPCPPGLRRSCYRAPLAGLADTSVSVSPRGSTVLGSPSPRAITRQEDMHQSTSKELCLW